jgi:hypothetical protein
MQRQCIWLFAQALMLPAVGAAHRLLQQKGLASTVLGVGDIKAIFGKVVRALDKV